MDLDLDLFDSSRPPVVLVGGLNLVRALGRGGLDAIVAYWDPEEPAFASRYCKGRVPLPRPGPDGAAAETLMALGAEIAGRLGRRIPLICGSDDALTLVQAHRERLHRHFLFLMAEPDVACALVAKDRFGAFARHRGLPVPRSLAWNGDGPGSVRGTEGPVVVKPSAKLDWHHTVLCEKLFGGDGKARVFASGAEAAAHPLVVEFSRQLTFQEFVPGGDPDHWSFHGFADESGHVLASFVGRKVRTFPAGAGESAFIEIANDESLEALGREVAAKCPLQGLFKMDFKRDTRDGRWHLLEINARASLWLNLGAANGVNLARVAYDYLVYGRAPEPVRAQTRYRWLSLALDWRAARELAARGELGLAAWARSILASRNIYNLFSWSDPGPWFALWRARFARRIVRAPRRFFSHIPRWRSTAS
ncbi:MAG TPA: ATP-grasp domain-containing protein [Usitatibacter sp.]|nr:ATP-grasp domain-containing protein [Usitatibacter sp.]